MSPTPTSSSSSIPADATSNSDTSTLNIDFSQRDTIVSNSTIVTSAPNSTSTSFTSAPAPSSSTAGATAAIEGDSWLRHATSGHPVSDQQNALDTILYDTTATDHMLSLDTTAANRHIFLDTTPTRHIFLDPTPTRAGQITGQLGSTLDREDGADVPAILTETWKAERRRLVVDSTTTSHLQPSILPSDWAGSSNNEAEETQKLYSSGITDNVYSSGVHASASDDDSSLGIAVGITPVVDENFDIAEDGVTGSPASRLDTVASSGASDHVVGDGINSETSTGSGDDSAVPQWNADSPLKKTVDVVTAVSWGATTAVSGGGREDLKIEPAAVPHEETATANRPDSEETTNLKTVSTIQPNEGNVRTQKSIDSADDPAVPPATTGRLAITAPSLLSDVASPSSSSSSSKLTPPSSPAYPKTGISDKSKLGSLDKPNGLPTEQTDTCESLLPSIQTGSVVVEEPGVTDALPSFSTLAFEGLTLAESSGAVSTDDRAEESATPAVEFDRTGEPATGKTVPPSDTGIIVTNFPDPELSTSSLYNLAQEVTKSSIENLVDSFSSDAAQVGTGFSQSLLETSLDPSFDSESVNAAVSPSFDFESVETSFTSAVHDTSVTECGSSCQSVLVATSRNWSVEATRVESSGSVSVAPGSLRGNSESLEPSFVFVPTPSDSLPGGGGRGTSISYTATVGGGEGEREGGGREKEGGRLTGNEITATVSVTEGESGGGGRQTSSFSTHTLSGAETEGGGREEGERGGRSSYVPVSSFLESGGAVATRSHSLISSAVQRDDVTTTTPLFTSSLVSPFQENTLTTSVTDLSTEINMALENVTTSQAPPTSLGAGSSVFHDPSHTGGKQTAANATSFASSDFVNNTITPSSVLSRNVSSAETSAVGTTGEVPVEGTFTNSTENILTNSTLPGPPIFSDSVTTNTNLPTTHDSATVFATNDNSTTVLQTTTEENVTSGSGLTATEPLTYGSGETVSSGDTSGGDWTTPSSGVVPSLSEISPTPTCSQGPSSGVGIGSTNGIDGTAGAGTQDPLVIIIPVCLSFIFVLVVLIIMACLCYRRRKKKRETKASNDDLWLEPPPVEQVPTVPVSVVEHSLSIEPPGEPDKDGLPIYRAIHEFPAQQEGQLALTTGDLVYVEETAEHGWMRGKVKGQEGTGWFPSSYVELVSEGAPAKEKEETEAKEEEEETEITEQGSSKPRISSFLIRKMQGNRSLKQNSFSLKNMTPQKKANAPVTRSASAMMPASPVNTTHTAEDLTAAVQGKHFKAVFAYKAAFRGELSLREGDIIQAKERDRNGWMLGRKLKTGEEGWFPAVYVDEVSGDVLHEDKKEEDEGHQEGPQLDQEVYRLLAVNRNKSPDQAWVGIAHRAIQTHTGKGDTDLSFKVGDIVTVFEALDSGWWLGCRYDAVGWFPGEYVELLEEKSDENSVLDTLHLLPFKKDLEMTPSSQRSSLASFSGDLREMAADRRSINSASSESILSDNKPRPARRAPKPPSGDRHRAATPEKSLVASPDDTNRGTTPDTSLGGSPESADKTGAVSPDRTRAATLDNDLGASPESTDNTRKRAATLDTHLRPSPDTRLDSIGSSGSTPGMGTLSRRLRPARPAPAPPVGKSRSSSVASMDKLGPEGKDNVSQTSSVNTFSSYAPSTSGGRVGTDWVNGTPTRKTRKPKVVRIPKEKVGIDKISSCPVPKRRPTSVCSTTLENLDNGRASPDADKKTENDEKGGDLSEKERVASAEQPDTKPDIGGAEKSGDENQTNKATRSSKTLDNEDYNDKKAVNGDTSSDSDSSSSSSSSSEEESDKRTKTPEPGAELLHSSLLDSDTSEMKLSIPGLTNFSVFSDASDGKGKETGEDSESPSVTQAETSTAVSAPAYTSSSEPKDSEKEKLKHETETAEEAAKGAEHESSRHNDINGSFDNRPQTVETNVSEDKAAKSSIHVEKSGSTLDDHEDKTSDTAASPSDLKREEKEVHGDPHEQKSPALSKKEEVTGEKSGDFREKNSQEETDKASYSVESASGRAIPSRISRPDALSTPESSDTEHTSSHDSETKPSSTHRPNHPYWKFHSAESQKQGIKPLRLTKVAPPVVPVTKKRDESPEGGGFVEVPPAGSTGRVHQIVHQINRRTSIEEQHPPFRRPSLQHSLSERRGGHDDTSSIASSVISEMHDPDSDHVREETDYLTGHVSPRYSDRRDSNDSAHSGHFRSRNRDTGSSISSHSSTETHDHHVPTIPEDENGDHVSPPRRSAKKPRAPPPPPPKTPPPKVNRKFQRLPNGQPEFSEC